MFGRALAGREELIETLADLDDKFAERVLVRGAVLRVIVAIERGVRGGGARGGGGGNGQFC